MASSLAADPHSQILLADIGGTHARFALLRAPERTHSAPKRFRVADYSQPSDALRAYFDEVGASPRRAVLAVAGPVDRGRASLTNATWTFDAELLAKRIGMTEVTLINDFAAQAWALAELPPDSLLHLGGSNARVDAPMVAVGPGTGLGVAAYLPPGDGADARVVAGEGGHASLAATDERETVLLEELRRRFGHVSAERVLSGPGLVLLAEVLAAMEGRKETLPATPEAVIDLARGGDATAAAAVDRFAAFLGSYAGDLALIFGARGGVFLTGGLPPALRGELAVSSLRGRFEAKGRFRDYLREIPTWIVTHPDPAFVGLSRVALNRWA